MDHRKVGIQILFSICENIKEEGINEERAYEHMMKSVFNENNFKLRREGILFLQRYFKSNEDKIEELMKTDRFQYFYMQELQGYFEDEDQQLICDSLEAVCPILGSVDNEMINIMIAKLVPLLDFKSHTTTEVTEQVSKLFGEITYKLHQRGLLEEH